MDVDECDFRPFVQATRLPIDQARHIAYPEGSPDVLPEPAVKVAVGMLIHDDDLAGIQSTIDRLTLVCEAISPDYVSDEEVFSPDRYLIVTTRPDRSIVEIINPPLEEAIAAGKVHSSWEVKDVEAWTEGQRLYHVSSILPIAMLVDHFMQRVVVVDGKLSKNDKRERRKAMYNDLRAAVSRFTGLQACQLCFRVRRHGRWTNRCRGCNERHGGKRFPELL